MVRLSRRTILTAASGGATTLIGRDLLTAGRAAQAVTRLDPIDVGGADGGRQHGFQDTSNVVAPGWTEINLLDEGAVATISDPGAAAQAQNADAFIRALAKLPEGGGAVRVPGAIGDYWCSSLPALSSGQYIIGNGPRASRLRVSDPTANGITIQGTAASATLVQAGVRDLALIGPESGTGIGLIVKWGAFGLDLDNLHIFGWGSHGAWQEDTYSVSWRDCAFDSNGGDGFHGLTNINQTTFDRCIAGNNVGAGFQVVGGAGVTFLGCNAESNGTYGIDLRYVFAGLILGGDFERNTLANTYLHWRTSMEEKCQSVTVLGVNFTGGGVTPVGLLIDGANGTTYEGCSFFGHTADHVRITVNGSRTWPGPNLFSGAGADLTDASISTFGVDRDQTNLWVRTRGKHYVTGEIEIDGALNHDGAALGFFGAPPVAQAAAQPDTAGATLAELEAEVNRLKGLLRGYGLLTTQ